MIYTDDLAEMKKEQAGEPYQPSNGTEGEIFMAAYCNRCKHDNLDPDTYEGGCEIIVRTMAFSPGDDDYPKEWCYGPDGQPVCTAFEMDNSGH